MDDNFKRCLDLLNENEAQVCTETVETLLGICDNIISTPDDITWRKVRVDHPVISEKLLSVCGAIECLFEMGYIEDGEYFTLPQEAPLSRIRQVQRGLRDVRTKLTSAMQPESGAKCGTTAARPKKRVKKNFLERIVDESKCILKYDDPQLRNKARQIVPLVKLQIGAMRRMRALQRDIKSNASGGVRSSIAENLVTADELLLAELLEWFKNDFFSWVDSPSCGVCGPTCEYKQVELSADPRISRTEIHRCKNCGMEVRFPRYTDPGILLKTRRGRCGEWANTFTLICRSLGFDARLVHDETDHVWTEIWSIASSRWIHADPSENVMDRPLLYERGWGKKLTYIMAYSRDEVQDVTWRYTQDQAAVMQRRSLCREEDLCSLICRLNEKMENSAGYSEARRAFVRRRRALELVDLMPAPPNARKPTGETDNEYGGRTSGSLIWRTSRGETRETGRVSPRTWKIPRNTKKMELRYFSAKDEYEFVNEIGRIVEVEKGWREGVDAMEGVFRKVETDWKVAYLARSEGQEIGKITWSLETQGPSVAVKFFRVRATSTTFHGATVRWQIRGTCEGGTLRRDVVLPVENIANFQTNKLNGSTKISVTAELAGGLSERAWQHAQIFRQSLESRENCCCSMSIFVETT